MNPVGVGQSIIPVVEGHGALGAVIICASVCIFGLLGALLYVVKDKKAVESKCDKTVQKLQEVLAEHFMWAQKEVERKWELERTLAQVASMKALMMPEDKRAYKEDNK